MIWWCMLALLQPAEARRQRTVPEPPEPPIPIETKIEEQERTPGSLFDDVQVRRLMGMDGNARQVGDIVTVRVLESSRTMLAASTDTRRKSSYNAAIRALLGVEKRILKVHSDLEEIGIDVASEADFSGSGDTTRDSDVQAVITCQVLEVYPNGNLRVWGWKRVTVNRETQFVVLDGIARPRDIQLDNTVSSDLLAQAKIEFSGQGVVADRTNGPGWFARVLDKLWPF